MLFYILGESPKNQLLPYKEIIDNLSTNCSPDLWLEVENISLKFQNKHEIIKNLDEEITRVQLLPTVEFNYYSLSEFFQDIDIEDEEEYEEGIDIEGEEDYETGIDIESEEDYETGIDIESEEDYETSIDIEDDFNFLEKNQIEPFPVELVKLTGTILKLGKVLENNVNELLLEKIVKASNLYLEKIFSYKYHLNEVLHTSEMLIQGLTLLNTSKVYDLIFDCMHRVGNDIIIHVPDNNSFHIFVSNKLSQLKTKFSFIEFYRLTKALESTSNGRYRFFQYRVEIFKLFSSFLKENHLFLNTYRINNSELSTEEKEVVLKLEGILGIPFYSYDMKFFIDEIMEYDFQYDFLRYYAIPYLFGEDFPFYQKNYWNYLFELEQKSNSPYKIIELIITDNIYKYKSNLDYLKQMLRKWSNIIENIENLNVVDKEGLQRYLHIYIIVVSNTLKLMKESGHEYYDESIIEYSGKILSLNQAKELVKDTEYVGLYDASDLVPYILQYYYTKNNNYIIKIDYDALKSKYLAKHKDLIIGLIDLLTESDTKFSLDGIHAIRPVLGEEFYKDILNYIDNFKVLYTSIDKVKFEKYLT